MRIMVLVLVAALSGCLDGGTSEVFIHPSDFSSAGVYSGDRWDVALAPIPEGACQVDVHLEAPAGDGISIGVQYYSDDLPLGRYIDEREGLTTRGWYSLSIRTPPNGPVDLIVVNQSGNVNHYVYGARVTVCR